MTMQAGKICTVEIARSGRFYSPASVQTGGHSLQTNDFAVWQRSCTSSAVQAKTANPNTANESGKSPIDTPSGLSETGLTGQKPTSANNGVTRGNSGLEDTVIPPYSWFEDTETGYLRQNLSKVSLVRDAFGFFSIRSLEYGTINNER